MTGDNVFCLLCNQLTFPARRMNDEKGFLFLTWGAEVYTKRVGTVMFFQVGTMLLPIRLHVVHA